jgi:hypothetical protein
MAESKKNKKFQKNKKEGQRKDEEFLAPHRHIYICIYKTCISVNISGEYKNLTMYSNYFTDVNSCYFVLYEVIKS